MVDSAELPENVQRRLTTLEDEVAKLNDKITHLETHIQHLAALLPVARLAPRVSLRPPSDSLFGLAGEAQPYWRDPD